MMSGYKDRLLPEDTLAHYAMRYQISNQLIHTAISQSSGRFTRSCCCSKTMLMLLTIRQRSVALSPIIVLQGRWWTYRAPSVTLVIVLFVIFLSQMLTT